MRGIDGLTLLVGGLLVVGAPIVGFVFSSRWMRKLAPAGPLRTQALAQFQDWLRSPAAEQLALTPDLAEPALETENFVEGEYGAAHYSLTWYLRDADGHYVMLMSTSNAKPFVKVLEDRYAKVVLKSRYQAPD